MTIIKTKKGDVFVNEKETVRFGIPEGTMAKWNDTKSYSMSFDLKADEATLDFFKREMQELEDFEKVINARIKQLFDEFISVGGEKKGEAYNLVLKVFMSGYGHGWNDRKTLDDQRIKED